MTEVATLTAPAAASTAPSTTPAQLDPAETRMFANMMQGGPVPTGASRGALGDAAMAVAAQLGGQVRSVEDMRRSMLAAIDTTDPFKTLVAVTDHAIEAQMTFSRLHMSTALASAATNLFGTLLKNQQ
jgi:hypothetical protein